MTAPSIPLPVPLLLPSQSRLHLIKNLVLAFSHLRVADTREAAQEEDTRAHTNTEILLIFFFLVLFARDVFSSLPSLLLPTTTRARPVWSLGGKHALMWGELG